MAHTTSGSEGENLSRIKEILFGEDLQSIEQKLGDVKDENSSAFEKLKIELENRFKKIELLIETKLKDADRTNGKTLEIQKTINDELKQEIVNIGIAAKTEKVNFEKTINDNIKQVTSKINDLENTLTKAINKLKEDYEIQLNELNKGKISKSTLADLLTELAKELNK